MRRVSQYKRRSSHEPITCDYLQYRLPNGHMILLPLIQVELVSATENITTVALLDSGATLSFIPYEIAEMLDLLSTISPSPIDVVTAGGISQFRCLRLRKLSLIAGGKIFSDFANFPTLIPSQTATDLPYAILGRDSVFKRFHVTFKEKAKKFTLVHHKYVHGPRFHD